MAEFINFFLVLFLKMGYAGIFLLMTIESSFIPFPSELIIPPAAYLAQKGELNIMLVVLFGTLGSLLGAIINYFVALTLGRKIIYKLARKKWAKYLLINDNNLKKAEDFFIKNGRSSTFLGRLIPAIRQLISIPAGFAKMNFPSFAFYTTLGAGIWVIVLAALGYWFGANEMLLQEYYHEITIAGILIAILFVIYLVIKSYKEKN